MSVTKNEIKGYQHTWTVGSKFPTKSGGVITILSFKEGSYSHCYIECNICHKDKELFPEPLCVNKYKLKAGQNCCACGFNYKWKEWQYEIRVKRVCDKVGYTFNGWSGEYKGIDTRLNLTCDRGHNYTPSIDGFTGNRRRRCLKCSCEDSSLRQQTPENILMEYVVKYEDEDHKFLRFEKSSGRFYDPITVFYCKVHNTETSCGVRSLKKGRQSLPCCQNIDKGGYFYLTSWGLYEEESFLKYGITQRHPRERMYAQARHTKLEGRIEMVIKFQYLADALLLESEVKNIYGKHHVEKSKFKDGYTETLIYHAGITEYDIYPDIYVMTGLVWNIEEGEYILPFRGEYWLEDIRFKVNKGGTSVKLVDLD